MTYGGFIKLFVEIFAICGKKSKIVKKKYQKNIAVDKKKCFAANFSATENALSSTPANQTPAADRRNADCHSHRPPPRRRS